MTSAADDTRYVARRSGPVRLTPLPPPRAAPARAPSTPPPLPSPEPETTMAAKKKPKRYTPTEKTAILAELGSKSVAQVAADHEMSENTLYTWKSAAKKAAGLAAKGTSKRAPVATNGHAGASDAPTIQLAGLRSWVNAAARDELKRVFAAMLEELG